jgi:hypothetical protein
MLNTLAQVDLGDRSTLDPMIIFLHVPKAGGTSLNGIINQQYAKHSIFRFDGINNYHQLEQLPLSQRENLKLIRGHFAFGLHQSLPCPSQYFTLLRDPVARFISHYQYARRSPNVPGHVQAKSLSLHDYTQCHGEKVGNLQTRLLFGLSSTDASGKPDLLQVVQRNLDQHFAVVGLVERFDETLVLLQQTFGWRTPVYIKQNVTSQKQKDATTLDPNTLQAIEQCNALDMELYRYAQSRFEQQIEAIGDAFATLLQKQQFWNGVYQPFGQGYGTARRFMLNQVKPHR